MKKSFEKSRIINEEWEIKGFKEKVPTYLIKPKSKTDKALIYVPGLNGNGSLIRFFNYKEFNNCYLFSFDARAQGNNKNKASRFYKKYVRDLIKVINEFKRKNKKVKEIYLCGESWGSTLSILAYKKTKKKKLIEGVIGWNMPYSIVDLSSEKGWKKVKRNLKVFFTFITSISTYDESPLSDKLTNNATIKKVILMVKNNKLNNKVPIAAWRSFKKSWKIVENHDKNIRYIQSWEDAMLSRKGVKKINSLDHVVKFDKGYHILTFDEQVQDKLFYEIFYFINIKL